MRLGNGYNSVVTSITTISVHSILLLETHWRIQYCRCNLYDRGNITSGKYTFLLGKFESRHWERQYWFHLYWGNNNIFCRNYSSQKVILLHALKSGQEQEIVFIPLKWSSCLQNYVWERSITFEQFIFSISDKRKNNVHRQQRGRYRWTVFW